MLSCVIDGVINLWYQDYSTLIVFCVDCAIIASCDFAMIKGIIIFLLLLKMSIVNSQILYCIRNSMK